MLDSGHFLNVQKVHLKKIIILQTMLFCLKYFIEKDYKISY